MIFQANFGRLSAVIGLKRKRGKFFVLSKIVFYEFPKRKVEPEGEFQIEPMCILDRKVTMLQN